MKTASLVAVAIGIGTSMGCGSSPPSTFYALSPESGAVHAAPVRTLKLRRPGIAGYLDRPEIVRRIVDHRLGLVDTDRWAAPLDEMLARVLAQDVEQRLQGSVVFTEDGAITADADLTIEIDLRRFDVGESGEVNLVAEIALEKGDGHEPVGARSVHLRELPSAVTTPALLVAMSDLVGQLADEVGLLARDNSGAPTAIGESALRGSIRSR
jgi:uncharacterized lipoprotein YmbA